MAGKIQRFQPMAPAGQGLAVWPAIPASELAAGQPVQRGHYYLDDKAHGLSAGVWDCTPMTSTPMSYPVNEFMLILEGDITIVEDNGRATTIKAGESFILPKGLPCVWQQPHYVRKFFVIFDDASGLAPKDPAGLRVLRPDPKAELSPSEGPAAAVLDSPPPRQRDKLYFADLTGQWTVGVWETSAYRRKTITFPRHELMHILEGCVTITEEGGPSQTFTAGDTFFVPMGTGCDWRCDGQVRKIYCIFQPKAAAAKNQAAE
ncbi:MAG: cupin domain-containing protein [Dongiaceae bacterium]